MLTIFYYEGNFEEAFQFAKQGGVKPYDLMVLMHQNLDEAPAEFQQIISDFIQESREELFTSREACTKWAQENYDLLVDGTLGGNLLSKYSMLGRFFVTQSALTFLESIIRDSLSGSGEVKSADPLEDVILYLRNILLYSPFAQSLPEKVEWESVYDVDSWVRDGYIRPLLQYEMAGRRLHALVEPDRKTLIGSKIETFGDHPSGLGKFTRTLFARDLRRTMQPVDPTQIK